MKYENYRLPGGKTLSEGTFEDIRWQYGVFRCNSTGAGRDKKYTPWRAVKTKLGEIEECDWCKLVEAVIERENEVPLLKCGRRRSSFMLPGSSTILNGSVSSPLTQNIGQKY